MVSDDSDAINGFVHVHMCVEKCAYAYMESVLIAMYAISIYSDAELPAELRANVPDADADLSPTATESEKVIYPDPEIERDVYVPSTQMSNNSLLNDGADPMQSPEFRELLAQLQQAQQAGGGAGPNSFMTDAMMNGDFLAFANATAQQSRGGLGAPGARPKPAPVPDTPIAKFLKSKLHIGLLAIMTYAFINVGYSCNVFLIFLLWEVIEMFALKQYETKSGNMLSLMLLLSGMPPAKLNVLLKWMEIGKRVLRDVAMFLFFFVLSHICCHSFDDGDIDTRGTSEAIPKINNTIIEDVPYVDEFGVEF